MKIERWIIFIIQVLVFGGILMHLVWFKDTITVGTIVVELFVVLMMLLGIAGTLTGAVHDKVKELNKRIEKLESMIKENEE
ncbi:MAG: hypothetical protein FWD76_06180 [Firmicutes bacterium]|nr:hypothetical protein [Bacillota bacterium]